MVKICSHCGFVDDPELQRCPCPHDEMVVRARQREAGIRHRAAVARARERVLYERLHGRAS